MTKNYFLILFMLCLFSQYTFTQEIDYLSTDYLNPTQIKVNKEYLDINLRLDSKNQEDFAQPSCSDKPASISYYFSFILPESGFSNIIVETSNISPFGIAVYNYDENNNFQELTCNIISRSNKGVVTLEHNHSSSIDYNEVVARIWLINGALEGNVNISVFHNNYLSDDDLHQNEINIKEKIKQLENSHKRLASLPLSKDYIFNTIFPEIQEERINVAPNFPVRGNNNVETKENQVYWLKNYPDEFYFYIEFLNNKYNYYKNKFERE